MVLKISSQTPKCGSAKCYKVWRHGWVQTCDPPAKCAPNPTVATPASFFRDGAHIMDPQLHACYIAQSLYLANWYYLSRVSPSFSIGFSAEKSFESLSYQDKQGITRDVMPWQTLLPLTLQLMRRMKEGSMQSGSSGQGIWQLSAASFHPSLQTTC